MLHASVWRTYSTSAADVAAVLLSVAGALHVGAAPQHWGHSPAHGLFLTAIGLAELAWATMFWRGPSRSLGAAGAVLAGGSIVLWAITRVLPAPFGHGPEGVGVIDSASKLPEVLVLGILFLEVVREPRNSSWARAASLLGVALAAGTVTFLLATAAEPALPWLAGDHDEKGAVAAVPVHVDVPDRLQVVVAGIGTPLVSGDELAVAGDLGAQITFVPAGARFSRDLSIRLFRSGGEAVSDASIVATGHMRFMDHGAFRQAATPSSDGEYALPLVFVMPGEWQVDLEIVTPAERGAVHLEVDLVE
jgi:YtkA-like